MSAILKHTVADFYDAPCNHPRKLFGTAIRPLYLQQSLLLLIDSHFLKRLLTLSLAQDPLDWSHPIRTLLVDLLIFFKHLGFSSQRFFDVALIATKSFLKEKHSV
ncbi:hypothetical protein GEMRC1_006436 [Eukaryota sp. GEM-RC1]